MASVLFMSKKVASYFHPNPQFPSEHTMLYLCVLLTEVRSTCRSNPDN